MIFYSNSNIQQVLHKQKKENNTMPRAAQELGPQAGPSALGPRGRYTRLLLPQAVTDGRAPLVRLPFLPSLRDADGKVPPVSFSFNTHGGSATTPAAGGEGLSPRARAHQHRLTFAMSLLSPNRALPSPSTSATRKAGGRHSRPQAGH